MPGKSKALSQGGQTPSRASQRGSTGRAGQRREPHSQALGRGSHMNRPSSMDATQRETRRAGVPRLLGPGKWNEDASLTAAVHRAFIMNPRDGTVVGGRCHYPHFTGQETTGNRCQAAY